MNPKLVTTVVLASTTVIFGAGTLCVVGLYELRIARLKAKLGVAEYEKDYWKDKFSDLAHTLPADELFALADKLNTELEFNEIVRDL